MIYLLDTNVCIELMRGSPIVVDKLSERSPQDCVISAITSYELQTGVRKCRRPAQETAKLDHLLAHVRELPFGADAAVEAAEIRVNLEKSGRSIGPYDVLIAGHARALDLVLVTANVVEFSRIAGLRLENWTA